ncbi:nucleotide exchange factor GrpE [Nakamurella antarctica]|uniref:Protein GrpE n=1 Tax=Nakamurella antarctica TaxID=1902245 RepID=A0A3G8ZPN8_9ACTN|nr:nucleotide exchange factor GrpE [Nakamurella antarctica]AZI59108.1 nucleotide exchange factor GrpE [Nakamurella antarctica]
MKFAKNDPQDVETAAEEEVSDEFAELTAQLAERTTDLQRVSAEYANYRKRIDRDREASVINAKASVITELLSVLDDLDRAQAHGDLTGAFKAVADRLTGSLEKLGLEPFGAEGDAFDPSAYEAVQFGTSPDVTSQVVTSVMRRGFSFKGKLIRAAVVGVTGPEQEAEVVDSERVGSEVADAELVADDEDRADDAASRAEQATNADPGVTAAASEDDK